MSTVDDYTSDPEDSANVFGDEMRRERRNVSLHVYLKRGGSMADLARARMEKNAERVAANIEISQPGACK